MRAYFDGDLRALDAIPVHQPGTPPGSGYGRRMRAVPPGTTVSYTELAARAGQSRARPAPPAPPARPT